MCAASFTLGNSLWRGGKEPSQWCKIRKYSDTVLYFVFQYAVRKIPENWLHRSSCPFPSHEDTHGGAKGEIHSFFTSARDSGKWPMSHRDRFKPRGKKPGTIWTGRQKPQSTSACCGGLTPDPQKNSSGRNENIKTDTKRRNSMVWIEFTRLVWSWFVSCDDGNECFGLYKARRICSATISFSWTLFYWSYNNNTKYTFSLYSLPEVGQMSR
jgi:hypothetical protein